MRSIAEYALTNKALIKLFIAFLVIGGLWSFYSMSKMEDPEITVKQALVMTVYPGADAHQVEFEVSDKLEKAIRQMGDIDYIESKSMNDLSLIKVVLKTTVPNDEMDQKWDILRKKIVDAHTLLPKGSSVPLVLDDFSSVYGMFYTVTADGFSDSDMIRYTQFIQRELINIEGVRNVQLYGTASPCININIDKKEMARLGISPVEILLTLQDQNKTVYGGYFNSSNERMKVMVPGTFQNMEDIRNLVLKGHNGELFRLGMIANVEEGYETPQRNMMKYDGQKAYGIAIAMESGYDILKIGKVVTAKLAELEGQLPVGFRFNKVFYQYERLARLVDKPGGFLYFAGLYVGIRVVAANELTGFVVEFGHSRLGIFGNVENHGTRTTVPGDVKSSCYRPSYFFAVTYLVTPFGHRLGDSYDIGFLKSVRAQ